MNATGQWKVQATVNGRVRVITVDADSPETAIFRAGAKFERRNQGPDLDKSVITITDAQLAEAFARQLAETR